MKTDALPEATIMYLHKLWKEEGHIYQTEKKNEGGYLLDLDPWLRICAPEMHVIACGVRIRKHNNIMKKNDRS